MQEVNRLAFEQETREQVRWLKSRLTQLQADYERGVVDSETYSRKEAQIVNDITKLIDSAKNYGNSGREGRAQA